MFQRKRHLVAVVVVASLGTTIGLAAVQGGPATSNNQAVAAAKARQDSAKTIFVEFKETEVLAKGAISNTAVGMPFQSKTPVPSEETKHESVSQVIIDGDKVRFENHHPFYHMPDGTLIQKPIVSLYDGNVANKFFPMGLGFRTDTPIGIIEKNQFQGDIKAILLAPITAAFRGMTPAISLWLISSTVSHPTALVVNACGLCWSWTTFLYMRSRLSHSRWKTGIEAQDEFAGHFWGGKRLCTTVARSSWQPTSYIDP